VTKRVNEWGSETHIYYVRHIGDGGLRVLALAVHARDNYWESQRIAHTGVPQR